MKLRGLTMEQYLLWERDGYLAIENFLSDEEIQKYNSGLDHVLSLWKSKGCPNSDYAKIKNVEQVSGIIEYDDMFLELMEHPRMMDIMRDVYGDSFVMIDNDGLLKQPGQPAHTSWHRDTGMTLHAGEKRIPFMVKIFYFLADVPFDGGCLAFLPGSRYMRDEQLPKVDQVEEMPGHVRMNVKAGTAVLFDGGTYHSAFNNLSGQTRRSIIYNYASLFLRTWPGYEPSDKLITKAQTRLSKMLLGMLPWIEDPKAFEETSQESTSA